jgi:hypothetical protein
VVPAPEERGGGVVAVGAPVHLQGGVFISKHLVEIDKGTEMEPRL